MRKEKMNDLLEPEYMAGKIVDAQLGVMDLIRSTPSVAFKDKIIPATGTRKKKKVLINADFHAEIEFQLSLTKAAGGEQNLLVYGEESIEDRPSLENEKRTCVLVDMVDGTDLLVRGFFNWCSAVVVFNPQLQVIEGSFVMLRDEHSGCLRMYYATKNLPEPAKIDVLVKEVKGKPNISYGDPVTLAGPTISRQKGRDLRNASVCMYAQKSSRLLSLLELHNREGLVRWLKENIEEDKKTEDKAAPELKFRFYNLAGNPMLAKLADGVVDAVFDLNGQAAHDVVPGAYIALRAGAELWDMENHRPMTESRLVDALKKDPNLPKAGLSYIVASNADILRDLRALF